jgi:hypothetical protein
LQYELAHFKGNMGHDATSDAATIASHNAHDAPSAGFPYYINYRDKDDVMI